MTLIIPLPILIEEYLITTQRITNALSVTGKKLIKLDPSLQNTLTPMIELGRSVMAI